MVQDGDRIVGEAEVFDGRRAAGHVHPDARGRGIGTWLLRWTEERMREQGGSIVGQTVSDPDRTAVELLRDAGYAPRRTAWVLEIHHDRPPAPPGPPDGIGIRRFVPGRDDREVFQVIEDAFNEWPDREPERFEDWAAPTIRRSGFEPWMLPLGVDGNEIVGAAFCIRYPDAGWVEQLAVKATHRGRGIARALLQHSFGEFYRRGERTCGLSTDSRTGALDLYERLGMRVTRSYTHLAKELAPPER